MAVVLENSQLVWKKVKNALANANPAHQAAFKGLKEYLSTQGRNPDLQFISYSEVSTLTDLDVTAAASKVYGWYGKAARTSGTTSSFVTLHAAATNDATTTSIASNRIKAAGQTFANVWPTGLACETGLAISSATTVAGATASTTPDGADGFVIVGAA